MHNRQKMNRSKNFLDNSFIFLQIQDIDYLLQWLCTTPKTTCIRINMLRTSTNDVQGLLSDEFKKNHPLSECPKISIIEQFPEVILIGNLKDTNDLRSIPDGKEVIVDVTCAASILRGIVIIRL